MPPSQLKALKTRLREKGITAPSKTKTQRKSDGNHVNPKDRHTALQQIRDDFNPFELRHVSTRPAKFPSTSIYNSAGSGKYAKVLHRPGVSKSAGEDMRRQYLLPEMRRRNKTGGLVDRRIGEGDEGMTAEQRAVMRFTKEKEGRRGGVFDLEGSDDEGGMMGLTHGGRAIDELEVDDMKGSGKGSESEDEDAGFLVKKRRREDEEEDDVEEAGEGQPDVKKSKKEVMQEVIAKSKLHKYERQKVKEDDEDLIDKLDAGMADLLPLLRSQQVPPPPPAPIEIQPGTTANEAGMKIDPERQKLLDGMDRAQADKDYEKRLRELAQDIRAKPSERTKTAEERAKEEAERLKELEERRSKRMIGEELSEDEEEERRRAVDDEHAEDIAVDALGNEEVGDDAEEFGLASAGVESIQKTREEVQHVDEDEFDFDADLVASASEAELSDQESEADDMSAPGEVTEVNQEQDEEDEFVKGFLGGANATPIADSSNNPILNGNGALAFTYPCPRSHAELLSIVEPLPVQQLPTVIQRIRALYHPSLSAANKEMMSDFSRALVDHLAYMAEHDQPLPVIEQVIRHLHSLSRTYAIPIAEAFRTHLLAWHERPGGEPSKGDLVILTAIGSIYPTSDHFHQIVTPATTLMGRWLAVNAPSPGAKTMDERRSRVGAFMVGLCVRWQALSKRLAPEAVRFTLRVLSTIAATTTSSAEVAEHLENLTAMAELWKAKTAFIDIFEPFIPMLPNLGSAAAAASQHLSTLLKSSRQTRYPLLLHNHRPQPLRTSNPKFEEGFNPDKHYDPDRERSDAAKLRKEVKREKKGAVRELRKDGAFVAREELREKRERDADFVKRERRLVAEIAQEGRENQGGGGGKGRGKGRR
ncbi:nucleolar complex protein 14 [Friedmanniomyces endolithicus]|uniref:Nucleolar complex protein 14 n=1 Tax=Friedmanniomyces endolithicus TaxID=329885 RepID=A0AAN6KR27_9PEZI|nr:nucleolar complex protein 14 [Friedmanniomyces endolithicus]KAK0285282.1 nucleolar complex protein 14 [Friedmanniomyces endolithicus]KAK0984187.1 nucleolar complex protein 14 [Friedmanniomyces endolithicus]KAK0994741.1 nucleolar complex protein 14 [Friedmanniomyces endolithicus]KAK0996660.1 nucleolar complex protein 14 [Friedmanniomyces endolithicus]